ncbi:MAG: Cysteine desulfurase IscS [Candidatus Marinimicrobia bacterium]|nr:Cysteine desulfurase IscS [Candidatus Neomarinimicrobiota bacterium]
MTGSVPPQPSADLIYLDHHASTPILPQVQQAMQPWLDRGYGNPSNTLHQYGREARDAVEWAKTQVANLINASPEEIIFTSGATEANNLALRGAVKSLAGSKGILITNVEHPSVVEPANYLKSQGVSVVEIEVNSDGIAEPENIEEIFSVSDIGFLSVIAVQGEIGTINPINSVAEIAHAHSVLIHTDAAQAVGKIPVNVRDWNIDYLTIAGHKMYGPKGVGALYRRKGAPLEPILFGAGHEQGMRPGTENVPYLVGFGEACRIASEDLENEAERQRDLRNYLWERVHQSAPKVRLNGALEPRHPGNLHISFPDIDSRELLAKLPKYALSVGSACHSENPEANPIIQSLGIPVNYAAGTIRVGIGRSNTRRQIEQFADDLIEAYQSLMEEG